MAPRRPRSPRRGLSPCDTRTRRKGARKPSGRAFGVAFECVRASALRYCESELSSFVLATMPK